MQMFFVVLLAICASVMALAIACVAVVWCVKVVIEYIDEIKDSIELQKRLNGKE